MSQQEWFVNFMGEIRGPYSPRELKNLATTRRISRETNLRLGADGDWMIADGVPGLFPKRESAEATQFEESENVAHSTGIDATQFDGFTNSACILLQVCGLVTCILSILAVPLIIAMARNASDAPFLIGAAASSCISGLVVLAIAGGVRAILRIEARR
ncbi:DUF4339 domain-containing protein [Planctomicrobium sp. SH527]|uniref:DUF4339 domain-containing protein n=1 Tax=Planctomicrobium sp. SH527 TaxID=3448123 RepID=UPI003F5B1EFA